MQPGGAGREAGAGLLHLAVSMKLSTAEMGAVLPGAPLVSTWGLSKCPPHPRFCTGKRLCGCGEWGRTLRGRQEKETTL